MAEELIVRNGVAEVVDFHVLSSSDAGLGLRRLKQKIWYSVIGVTFALGN